MIFIVFNAASLTRKGCRVNRNHTWKLEALTCLSLFVSLSSSLCQLRSPPLSLAIKPGYLQLPAKPHRSSLSSSFFLSSSFPSIILFSLLISPSFLSLFLLTRFLLFFFFVNKKFNKKILINFLNYQNNPSITLFFFRFKFKNSK